MSLPPESWEGPMYRDTKRKEKAETLRRREVRRYKYEAVK